MTVLLFSQIGVVAPGRWSDGSGGAPDQIRFSGFGEGLAQDPLHLVDRTRRPR
jgi:hypothetical protein